MTATTPPGSTDSPRLTGRRLTVPEIGAVGVIDSAAIMPSDVDESQKRRAQATAVNTKARPTATLTIRSPRASRFCAASAAVRPASPPEPESVTASTRLHGSIGFSSSLSAEHRLAERPPNALVRPATGLSPHMAGGPPPHP